MSKIYKQIIACILAGMMMGCSSISGNASASEPAAEKNTAAEPVSTEAAEPAKTDTAASSSAVVTTEGSEEYFTERDLEQTADLSEAVQYTVKDGEDISITEEGIYVLSGSASEVTVSVEAADEDKVQIVLDGVSITNTDSPCIYVKSADKVFVTTTSSDNTLTVTGTFTADGTTNTDAVIFSKDDLVLNGTGTLTIKSTENGITSKDDLKVTGGTYTISCTSKALEANDSIAVADGTFTLEAGTDGLHAENDDDDTVGYIYIEGGTFDISCGDDGIHATTTVTINDGTINITAAEGIEATIVEINDGVLNIQATDDGINASRKSNSLSPSITINGGDVTVVMGGFDSDAIDANGNITINGGTVTITADSAFDYDGTGTLNGGTVIVNGSEVTTLTSQMMGGGMQGGQPGMQGGQPGMQGETGTMQGTAPNMQGGAPGGMQGGMRR